MLSILYAPSDDNNDSVQMACRVKKKIGKCTSCYGYNTYTDLGLYNAREKPKQLYISND